MNVPRFAVGLLFAVGAMTCWAVSLASMLLAARSRRPDAPAPGPDEGRFDVMYRPDLLTPAGQQHPRRCLPALAGAKANRAARTTDAGLTGPLPVPIESIRYATRSQGMRSSNFAAAACIVACVVALPRLLAAGAPAQALSPARERQVVDKMLADEYRRLVATIEDPATPGDNRKYAYYQIAGVGTADAVDFLRRTYEQCKQAGKLYPSGDGPDLVFMLWNIHTPESAALLLHMIRDGHRDLRLVRAYAEVAGGNAALPELRLMFKEGRNEDIRFGARLELIRFGDKAAVSDLLRRLEPPGQNEKDPQRIETAISNVIDARATAAVPALRRLSDHFGPADAGHLHHRVVHALLYLRDTQSIPRAIHLLEAAPPLAAQRWGMRATPDLLAEVTGERFGNDPAAWKKWWDERGARLPGPAQPPDGPAQPGARDERSAVEAAFLAWATTPAAGPVVPGPVVYVQDSTGKRPSTDSVRYYRETELRLLGVHHIRIDRIDVQPKRALVQFYGPTDFHGPGPTADLVKDEKGWTVRGYVRTDVQ